MWTGVVKYDENNRLRYTNDILKRESDISPHDPPDVVSAGA